VGQARASGRAGPISAVFVPIERRPRLVAGPLAGNASGQRQTSAIDNFLHFAPAASTGTGAGARLAGLSLRSPGRRRRHLAGAAASPNNMQNKCKCRGRRARLHATGGIARGGPAPAQLDWPDENSSIPHPWACSGRRRRPVPSAGTRRHPMRLSCGGALPASRARRRRRRSMGPADGPVHLGRRRCRSGLAHAPPPRLVSWRAPFECVLNKLLAG
jgi:hypothetical protein